MKHSCFCFSLSLSLSLSLCLSSCSFCSIGLWYGAARLSTEYLRVSMSVGAHTGAVTQPAFRLTMQESDPEKKNCSVDLRFAAHGWSRDSCRGCSQHYRVPREQSESAGWWISLQMWLRVVASLSRNSVMP